MQFRLVVAFLFVSVFAASPAAFADADYSLSCSMNGSTATVYACNSGDSAEGNNEYVTVEACSGSLCDDDYDLFYIYALPGGCDAVGTMSFSESHEYCMARFRD